MDNLTETIKEEIKKQYGNLMEFSRAIGIPYSTLSNALTKGVGGTSYNTVVRICQSLGIRQAMDEDLVIFNREFHDFYEKLTELDKAGVHTVIAVLNAEYLRCVGKMDPSVKGFSGVGYVEDPKYPFDEKVVMKLVKKVRKERISRAEKKAQTTLGEQDGQ